jgi:hypothetical protein
MLSSNLAGTSGSKAAGGQVFSPTMVPHNQIQLPDTLAHWPSFPNLIYPFANSYPNLNAHQAQHQHPLPFSMSRDMQSLNKDDREMGKAAVVDEKCC